MTALAEYVQLESSGLWREAPDVQRRDVGLSFGDASLVIVDSIARPLAHWSLPAIVRLNPGTMPALYSPDPDAFETVEIADELMVEALEKVRRGIERARPHPGRLRTWGRLGVLAATVAVAALWLPGALRQQTQTALPQAKRAEIGATLLGHMQRTTGQTCRNALGTSALATLHARLLGADAQGQVVVVPADLAGPIYLPGGIIVLSRTMIEDAQDPAVVAGYVLAAALSRPEHDPLGPILRDAGLMATLTLLTTGNLPTDVLERQAQTLLDTTQILADPAQLVRGFAAADVPMGPWAAAAGPDAATMAPYRAAAAGEAPPAAPILSDGSWVSLQGICAG